MKILMLGSGSIKSNFMYRLLALGKALQRHGHEVTIIAPKADKYNNFVPETITSIDGVHILQPFQFATKRLEINLLPYMLDAMRLVLHEKPDVVYIYKPTPISIVGLVPKLFQRTPTVLDMDDLGSEVMRIEGHPIYQQKLVEWSERLASRFADRLIVASTFLRDLQQEKFPYKPVKVLPNGVESAWFKNKLKQSTHKKQIIFFGSLNRATILDPLFDVLPDLLKTHPTTQVLIIGDGQFTAHFKKRVKELRLEKRVTFTGWLPLEEARLLLCAGDIGYNYMPNERTVRAASNMKVPQYMACGVVPLVSDVGDLLWMVDGGKAGYVAKPDNTTDLLTVLLTALGDKDRLKKAERARKYAQTTFDWDALAGDVDCCLMSLKKELPV